jgi:hypothetical protein
MTMQSARAQLELAVEEAWSAIGELVLIALQDQPTAGSLAVADAVAEQISEIQGDLDGARFALADRADLVDVLPAVMAGLDQAALRYWQRVRAHGPTAQLRDATRRLSGPWPSWRRSVEQSAHRCEQPFAQTAAALQVCCQEICELVRSTPYDQLRRTS